MFASYQFRKVRQCLQTNRFVQHLFYCELLIPFFFLPSKLLGVTIQHEKPQLEVQKTELLRKEEELKVQLAELEDSLLEVRTKFRRGGSPYQMQFQLLSTGHDLKLQKKSKENKKLKRRHGWVKLEDQNGSYKGKYKPVSTFVHMPCMHCISP